MASFRSAEDSARQSRPGFSRSGAARSDARPGRTFNSMSSDALLMSTSPRSTSVGVVDALPPAEGAAENRLVCPNRPLAGDTWRPNYAEATKIHSAHNSATRGKTCHRGVTICGFRLPMTVGDWAISESVPPRLVNPGPLDCFGGSHAVALRSEPTDPEPLCTMSF